MFDHINCHTETGHTWLSGLLRAKYPSTTNNSERMWIPLVFGTDPTSDLSDKESRDSRVIRWLAISRHCKLVPSAPKKLCNKCVQKKITYINWYFYKLLLTGQSSYIGSRRKSACRATCLTAFNAIDMIPFSLLSYRITDNPHKTDAQSPLKSKTSINGQRNGASALFTVEKPRRKRRKENR